MVPPVQTSPPSPPDNKASGGPSRHHSVSVWWPDCQLKTDSKLLKIKPNENNAIQWRKKGGKNVKRRKHMSCVDITTSVGENKQLL